jgi:hypothetical protein
MLLIREPPFVKLIWLCIITQLDSTRNFQEGQGAKKSASVEVLATVTKKLPFVWYMTPDYLVFGCRFSEEPQCLHLAKI